MTSAVDECVFSCNALRVFIALLHWYPILVCNVTCLYCSCLSSILPFGIWHSTLDVQAVPGSTVQAAKYNACIFGLGMPAPKTCTSLIMNIMLSRQQGAAAADDWHSLTFAGGQASLQNV